MQRYFSSNKINQQLLLKEEDLYHIKVVMRMKPDDLIEVVYKKILYICKLNQDYVPEIERKIEEDIIEETKIILCIPLLQEQKMSLVLQKATELGVNIIVPILTTRSMVKLDKKEAKKLERWNKICKEASEQSKRLTIPVIENITKLEDLNYEGLRIVCSTIEKKNNIKKILKNNKNYDTIIIVVGPEGGLTIDEEKMLNNKGFFSTSLGKNIMRVETVPIYCLSVIKYELME